MVLECEFKEEEFGEEAWGGGYTGEGEEEESERESGDFIAIGESSEVFECIEGLGLRGAGDERDEESDQVKRVDEQIKEDRRELRVEGRGRIGGDLDNRDEEVSGISDGGVSDEAINIGLEECEEVTGDHSGEAREEEEVEDNGVRVLDLREEGDNFNEEGKGCDFKGSCHQSGDGHG